MISISVSLKPNECGVLSRHGLWHLVSDDWVNAKLAAMGTIPLGPYVLALDYDTNEFHLIHSTLFMRQVKEGANMESMGVCFVAPNEQIAIFQKAQQADAERIAADKLSKTTKRKKRLR